MSATIKKTRAGRMTTAAGVAPIHTVEEYEAAVNRVCELDIALRERAAALDSAIADLRAKEAKAVSGMVAEAEDLLPLCEGFARTNREALLKGGKKSAWVDQGQWGFASREAWAWPDGLEEVLVEAGQMDYVRLVPTVDKPAMKKAPEAVLAEFGVACRVVEAYFIKAKLDRKDRAKGGAA